LRQGQILFGRNPAQDRGHREGHLNQAARRAPADRRERTGLRPDPLYLG
jgi:hypothetical protein